MLLRSADKKPKHGYWLEYLLDGIAIINGICFVIGCYCFRSSDDSVYAFGDWLFIAACAVNTVISCHELLEKIMHKSVMKEKERDEVLEALCFLLANLLFTVGCVFFLPFFGSSFAASAAGA